MAVRWFVNRPDHTGRSGGELYAANTAGAAAGNGSDGSVDSGRGRIGAVLMQNERRRVPLSVGNKPDLGVHDF